MSYSAKREWKALVESYKVLSEASNVATWEDLKALFEILLEKEDLKELERQGGAAGKLAKNIISIMPGLNSVQALWGIAGQLKDIDDIVQGAQNAGEKAQTAPVLASLQVDPGYAEILDDRIESEFLKWFIDIYLPGKSGNITAEDDTVNEVLEQFLKQRGEHDESVVDGESSAKFTDLEMPLAIDKIDKLKSLAKGVFGGLF